MSNDLYALRIMDLKDFSDSTDTSESSSVALGFFDAFIVVMSRLLMRAFHLREATAFKLYCKLSRTSLLRAISAL